MVDRIRVASEAGMGRTFVALRKDVNLYWLAVYMVLVIVAVPLL